MAPEIIKKTPFDPFAADIWAIGVTFFLMATGKTPWIAYNLKELEKSISMGNIIFPPSINRFVAKFIIDILKMIPKSRPTASQLLNHQIFKTMPDNICCCRFLKCIVGCPSVIKQIPALLPSQSFSRRKTHRLNVQTFQDKL